MTETAREAFERLLAENPQFVEAPKTGQAVTIISGGRPTVGASRGTGRRPTGTCSSSAQENRRSIAPASRTSLVFRLTKPPLSSVATKSSIEGFSGRQFDPASPFSVSGEERPFSAFRADRGFAAASADAFRLSVPALRGAAASSGAGPPSEGRDWRSRKSMEENVRVPPASLVGRSDVFPLTSEARSATDQVSG